MLYFLDEGLIWSLKCRLIYLDVPKIPEMNLVFAISARSVDGPSIFQKMKDVIKAIVQKFGSNRFHYSVITFGDPFTTELSFDQQLPSDDDLQRVIGKTSVNAKRFTF